MKLSASSFAISWKISPPGDRNCNTSVKSECNVLLKVQSPQPPERSKPNMLERRYGKNWWRSCKHDTCISVNHTYVTVHAVPWLEGYWCRPWHGHNVMWLLDTEVLHKDSAVAEEGRDRDQHIHTWINATVLILIISSVWLPSNCWTFHVRQISWWSWNGVHQLDVMAF